jgi:hypothetical protein
MLKDISATSRPPCSFRPLAAGVFVPLELREEVPADDLEENRDENNRHHFVTANPALRASSLLR